MRIAMTLAALVLATSSLTQAANKSVHLKKQNGTLAITIDDKPFATLVSEGYAKPFINKIRGPAGTIVTRPVKNSVTEHPHHKGLWVAVDEVNELKHWREANKIRTESVEILTANGNPARYRIHNVWLDAEEKPLLDETSTVSIFADRLIAYDIKLTPAGDEPIEFKDTKEGFFAIRLRDKLRADKGSGHIVNSKGQKGEDGAWGQAANWVDYTGQVDDKTVGVSLFDHPANFRPGRYHARAYGLFSVSPFGPKAYSKGKLKADPVHLKPGETLRLRYAAWIHGDVEPAAVAERYNRYAKESGP